MNSNRVYTVSQGIRHRVGTQERRGFTVENVSMSLLCDGDVLHSWDSSTSHITTSLKREFNRHHESEEVKVQIIDATGECLWEGFYHLKPKQPKVLGEPFTQSMSGFSGPQTHDIGALVERQVQEIRQREELERLRTEQVELKTKNEELLGQVETLEAQIEAKSNLEYYSKVAGDLLPGIAKALEKTSLGPALSGLAGEQTQKDDQATVLDSTQALIAALDEEQLSAFYMLVLELQNNPALIPVLYQNTFNQVNNTADYETQH